MAIDLKLIDKLLADYKKPEDIIGENGLLKQLTKALLERAMQAEMTDHLGYEKHDPVGNNSGNSRNGKTTKTLKGDFGEMPLETPRDRNGTFEPKIVAKGQTRFTGFDDKIMSMYARGMSTREIQGHLEEIYGVEVSPDADLRRHRGGDGGGQDAGRAGRWTRSIRSSTWTRCSEDARRRARAKPGGLCGDRRESEGQQGSAGAVDGPGRRGQVLAAGADGDEEPRSGRYLYRLRGWAEGLSGSDRSGVSEGAGAVVHRASWCGTVLNYVSWKQRKAVAADLKPIYRASTAEEAEQQLERVR